MNSIDLTPNVKVSVAMITYNHEAFIAQAIESVLMQQTDFEFELVIGEDCSTDSTRAIVRDYGKRYPEQIRLLLPEHNQGMIPNFVTTMNACQGKYIAWLEGDDFWTDPCKLQKQVDFLEHHPECVLSFHNVKKFYQDHNGEPGYRNPPDQKPFLSIEDILVLNPIAPCSVLYRNGLVGEIPPQFYDLPMVDWPLWVLLAQHGKFGYMDDVMASYRLHAGGAYSSKTFIEWLPGAWKASDAIDRTLRYKYHSYVEKGITRRIQTTAKQYFAKVAKVMTLTEAIADLSDQCAGWNPRLRNRLLGELYSNYFFHAAEIEDYATVRKSSIGLAKYAPFRFKERRVLSRFAKALLGSRMSSWVRKTMRRAGL